VGVLGLPADAPEFPTSEQLRALLKSAPGRPVSTTDIEGDAVALLATGLFKTARPSCANAGLDEAPLFLGARDAAGGLSLKLVPPLGCINFVVAERSLPPITKLEARIDSSLKHLPLFESDLEAACATVLAASAAGEPALRCYLKLRSALIDLAGGGPALAVAFTGVESGRAEATLRATNDGDPPFVSGFEASARGGEGAGVEAFRPLRTGFAVSDRMSLPPDALARLVGGASLLGPMGRPFGAEAAAALPPPATPVRPWSAEELAASTRMPLPGSPVADWLAGELTARFGKAQARAGRKAGVQTGAAWRAALEAATEVGAQQVLLGDLPAPITQRKMGEALLRASAGRLAAAALAMFGSIAAAATSGQLPLSDDLDLALVLAGAAAASGLLWPLLGPLAEIDRFAALDAAGVEAAVALPGPIGSGDLSRPLKLYGEDALLDWPGVVPPLIDDRDAYMARALAATATAAPGFAPAFVRGAAPDGAPLWRLMMPEGAPAATAPSGLADDGDDGVCRRQRARARHAARLACAPGRRSGGASGGGGAAYQGLDARARLRSCIWAV
jgi:PAS domain-containing protein